MEGKRKLNIQHRTFEEGGRLNSGRNGGNRRMWNGGMMELWVGGMGLLILDSRLRGNDGNWRQAEGGRLKTEEKNIIKNRLKAEGSRAGDRTAFFTFLAVQTA